MFAAGRGVFVTSLYQRAPFPSKYESLDNVISIFLSCWYQLDKAAVSKQLYHLTKRH